MSDDSVYNSDTGEYLGEVVEAEDGALVLVDPDNNVIAAIDENHNELDPSEYQFVASDDPTAAFAEEIADLRGELAQLQQQPAPQPPAAGLSEDQIASDIASQAESLHKILGRQLTLREAEAVVDKLDEDLRAGRQPDALAAATLLAAEGQPLLNMDDDTERVQYMTERLQLTEREDASEDVTDPQPPTRESYDLDDHQQRVAWVTDRAEGRLIRRCPCRHVQQHRRHGRHRVNTTLPIPHSPHPTYRIRLHHHTGGGRGTRAHRSLLPRTGLRRLVCAA